MTNKFDELAKGLAQSVTRRQALRGFGVGLAGMALACFGLASRSRAATGQGYCEVASAKPLGKNWEYTGYCVAPSNYCFSSLSSQCNGGIGNTKGFSTCGWHLMDTKKPCSF